MISVQKNTGNTGIAMNQGYGDHFIDGDHFIEMPTDEIPAAAEKMLKAYLELKEGK